MQSVEDMMNDKLISTLEETFDPSIEKYVCFDNYVPDVPKGDDISISVFEGRCTPEFARSSEEISEVDDEDIVDIDPEQHPCKEKTSISKDDILHKNGTTCEQENTKMNKQLEEVHILETTDDITSTNPPDLSFSMDNSDEIDIPEMGGEVDFQKRIADGSWNPLWTQNLNEYYETFVDKFAEVGGPEYLKKLFSSSFASIIEEGNLCLDEEQNKCEIRISHEDDDEDEDGYPMIFKVEDVEGSVYLFFLGTLILWILHIRKKFSVKHWELSSATWDDIWMVLGGKKDGNIFPLLNQEVEVEEGPYEFAIESVFRASFTEPAFDRLKELYSESSFWNMIETVWTVPSKAYVTTFIGNKLSTVRGKGVCSSILSGCFDHKSVEGDVCYIHVNPNEPFDYDENEPRNFPKKKHSRDTEIEPPVKEFLCTVQLDQYPEKEQTSIRSLPESVYHLGHIVESSVSCVHDEFLKKFYPNEMTLDKIEMIKAVRCAIDYFWGAGSGDYDDDGGFHFLIRLYAQYARCAWHIDHILSSHLPKLNVDGSWTSVHFRGIPVPVDLLFKPKCGGVEKTTVEKHISIIDLVGEDKSNNEEYDKRVVDDMKMSSEEPIALISSENSGKRKRDTTDDHTLSANTRHNKMKRNGSGMHVGDDVSLHALTLKFSNMKKRISSGLVDTIIEKGTQSLCLQLDIMNDYLDRLEKKSMET